MVVVVAFLVKYPAITSLLFDQIGRPEQTALAEASLIAAVPQPGPLASIGKISAMLEKYGVDVSLRERVAKAIVSSGLKYNVDPRLVASIIIVESGANPFAISGSDSVGIMQIHLPTWGSFAEHQGINLFKIEDNADLGVRILSGYIAAHGIWGGVASYRGQKRDDPESQRGAAEYVQKVQKVYGLSQPKVDPQANPQ
jgi:soluble lytic murein transglycosylase-like protein